MNGIDYTTEAFTERELQISTPSYRGTAALRSGTATWEVRERDTHTLIGRGTAPDRAGALDGMTAAIAMANDI